MSVDDREFVRIEGELRESRNRLELALRAARMGIWEWEVSSGELRWSPGLEAIHGMAPDSFDGTFEGFVSVVHPDDRAALIGEIEAALRTGRPFATEFRAVGHDGVTRWIAGEGRAVMDADGRPARMIGVGRDVSGRHHADEALRESERRFRTMADSAPVLIWTTDPAGACTYLNAEWLRFTGRAMDDELGDGWVESVHPDDRQRRLAAYRSAAAEREPFEVDYRLRRADGAYRWLVDRGTPRRSPAGDFEGFVGSCMDITERRDAQERGRLVAEIGLVLNKPLSLGERLAGLAEALLPRVADACVVVLRDHEGGLSWAASAHVDPRYRDLIVSLAPPPAGTPLARVAESGEPLLFEEVGEEVIASASSSETEAEARRRLATRSAVLVPLIARGERIGALALATSRHHSDRALGEDDLRLAGEIADRAALAIDNARLFEIERAARRRMQFLSEAGSILSSSLDRGRTLQALAALTVPELADWCTIHLVGADGALVREALTHEDPERVRWATELSDRYPPDPDAATGLAAVIRGGEAELVTDIPDEALVAAAYDEEHLRLLREAGLTSFLCVPFNVGGQTIGALSLITAAESGRLLDAQDLELAQALADRAAVAIDHARLYEVEQRARDELERARGRAERLQRVTAALSRASSKQEVARAVVSEAMEALDARAGVVVLREGPVARIVSSVGYPDEIFQDGSTIEIDGNPYPLAGVLRTGHAFWFEGPGDWSRHFREPASRLGAAGIGLPLTIDGTVIGAIAFRFGEDRRPFSSGERQLTLTLAEQCAQALERARLYDAERETADVLQRTLLPDALPETARMEIAVRYLPAAEGRAGGDFYDALPLPDGGVSMIVGDVVGHGVRAAAVMGQLRSAWRALAATGAGPVSVLRGMSAFGLGVPGALAATAACATLMADGTLRFAHAGHPPALLIESGGTTVLDGARGVPLAVGVERWTEGLTRMEPGAVLLFYTDGVIERRGRTVGDGLDLLVAAVGSCRTRDLDDLLEAAVDACGPACDDDRALLACRYDPGLRRG